MTWGLISHPYHRGGVTSWMMDFFKSGVQSSRSVKFLTCAPTAPFISATDKKSIVSLLDNQEDVIAPPVDFRFELGSFSSRVSFYKKLIAKYLPEGSYLIPSDDEAVWQACSELSDRYSMVGILHSDDPYYYSLAIKYSPFVSGFVSVSERIKSKVASPKKHAVIPCGIKIEDSPQFPTKKKQLVFVGRIEEKQKRVSDLPLLMEEINTLDPDWKLILIGNGIDLPSLKDSFEQKGLSSWVSFLGWIPNQEVRRILTESRILLQTSNYEGMSVAVMEALSAGCQILSSKVSGVEDLAGLPDTDSVISIFPIGNIPQAVEGFARLNQDYSEQTAENSYQLAKSHFSIEACWDRYEAFCSGLIPVEKANSPSAGSVVPSDLLALVRMIKYKITS